MSFTHVDRYTGIHLGLDLGQVGPGEFRLVESPRRLIAGQS